MARGFLEFCERKGLGRKLIQKKPHVGEVCYCQPCHV